MAFFQFYTLQLIKVPIFIFLYIVPLCAPLSLSEDKNKPEFCVACRAWFKEDWQPQNDLTKASRTSSHVINEDLLNILVFCLPCAEE